MPVLVPVGSLIETLRVLTRLPVPVDCYGWTLNRDYRGWFCHDVVGQVPPFTCARLPRTTLPGAAFTLTRYSPSCNYVTATARWITLPAPRYDCHGLRHARWRSVYVLALPACRFVRWILCRIPTVRPVPSSAPFLYYRCICPVTASRLPRVTLGCYSLLPLVYLLNTLLRYPRLPHGYFAAVGYDYCCTFALHPYLPLWTLPHHPYVVPFYRFAAVHRDHLQVRITRSPVEHTTVRCCVAYRLPQFYSSFVAAESR